MSQTQSVTGRPVRTSNVPYCAICLECVNWANTNTLPMGMSISLSPWNPFRSDIGVRWHHFLARMAWSSRTYSERRMGFVVLCCESVDWRTDGRYQFYYPTAGFAKATRSINNTNAWKTPFFGTQLFYCFLQSFVFLCSRWTFLPCLINHNMWHLVAFIIHCVFHCN